MIPRTTLNQLVAKIHQEPELYGCIIGFHGNNQSTLLSPGVFISTNYDRVIVVLEEGKLPGHHDARPHAAVHSPAMITNSNRSRVGSELAGAGLSCG